LFLEPRRLVCWSTRRIRLPISSCASARSGRRDQTTNRYCARQYGV
jgi:hypothetical protein